jgi:uncharacterized OB-fold protein
MTPLDGLAAPGPNITLLTRPFWEAAAEGRLMIQHCPACGQHVFYPRAICPYCWSDQLDWVAASGEATLETWSTVMRPSHPAWESVAPYTVGIVRLAEGPTMLTHLLATPASLALHQALHVQFVRLAYVTLPCFGPIA